MNSNLLLIALTFLVTVLVVTGVSVSAVRKPSPVRADHHSLIFRGAAAFVAITALLITAVGTWRGGAVYAGSDFEVVVPTRPPREITKSGRVDIGPSKLIVNVVIARSIGGRFLPLQVASRFIEWNQGMATVDFDLAWQGEPLEVSAGFENFYQEGGVLSFWSGADEPAIRVTLAGRTDNPLRGSRPLGMLNVERLEGKATWSRLPFSLVPAAIGDVCLLVHVARADRDDPLANVPAAPWLANQPVAPGRIYQINSLPDSGDARIPPGLRMLAYFGPSAWLLLLAAAAGSMCFRRGWRGPAFAGLTAAMVIYAGALDALSLWQRARVMTDPSRPLITRVNAMLSLQDTFFHKLRARAAIDGIAGDAGSPAPLREMARLLSHDQTNPD